MMMKRTTDWQESGRKLLATGKELLATGKEMITKRMTDWLAFRAKAIEAYEKLPSSAEDKGGSLAELLSEVPRLRKYNYWEDAKGIPCEVDDPKAFKEKASKDLVLKWKDQLGDPPDGESFFICLTEDDCPMILLERRFNDCTIRHLYYVHFALRNKTATAYLRSAVYFARPDEMPLWKKVALGVGIVVALALPALLVVGVIWLGVDFWRKFEQNLQKVAPKDVESGNPRERLKGHHLERVERTIRSWLEENFNDLDKAAQEALNSPSQVVGRRPPPSGGAPG